MKLVYQFFAIALLLMCACKPPAKSDQNKVTALAQHKDIVIEFQDGQERFKSLVAGIKDEESFDAAKPSLDAVVSEWKNIAVSLQQFDPPSEAVRQVLRSQIRSGHEQTEPSGGDLMSFVSIESREQSALDWIEEFAAAGSEVGVQFARLYGPSGYGELDSQSLEAVSDNGAIIGTSLNSRLFAPPQDGELTD